MKDAGLGSLPGGGAEIFHPEIRDKICEHKADTSEWFNIHRTAHELGLRSNATMLYGHIENAFHRTDHLLKLRELQDETAGFQTFIPLAFHPENTKLSHLPKPSGAMSLRTMAISRLVLDNFDHLKEIGNKHQTVEAVDLNGGVTNNSGGPGTFVINLANDPPGVPDLVAPLMESIQTNLTPFLLANKILLIQLEE